jgi:acyl-CoA reductase-like NAD-dependent aldehyde dehydrogenase
LIPDSSKREADIAVESARQAFKTWSTTSATYRSSILNKIADEIEKRIDEFALAESNDQGKPLSLSLNVEIPRGQINFRNFFNFVYTYYFRFFFFEAIENFRFFASSLLIHRNDSTNYSDRKIINYTTETPAGVAVLISPWNLPLYLLSWKIAPCLAAGCTCVCKPSEFTSLTAHLLCDCFLKAGLPEGVYYNFC